jgi:hypothetical protein
LTAAELDRLWTQLTDNGTPACDAIEALAGAPTQAISFLSPRLRAVWPTAEAKRIAAVIAKLDDDKFSVRETATAELEKLGLEGLPQLRRAMEESKSLEVRLRAQRLVKKINNVSLTPDQMRLQAVLFVFELIASDDARNLLGEVASGKAGAWLAAEAEVTLRRMQIKQGRDKR